jgi:hypothetical protein
VLRERRASKDKASGPLLFQGATLLIMYQVLAFGR